MNQLNNRYKSIKNENEYIVLNNTIIKEKNKFRIQESDNIVDYEVISINKFENTVDIYNTKSNKSFTVDLDYIDNLLSSTDVIHMCMLQHNVIELDNNISNVHIWVYRIENNNDISFACMWSLSNKEIDNKMPTIHGLEKSSDIESIHDIIKYKNESQFEKLYDEVGSDIKNDIDHVLMKSKYNYNKLFNISDLSIYDEVLNNKFNS